MGSADGVEVFVESTVASNHVKDGSVAHLVLKKHVVPLATNRTLPLAPYVSRDYQ